MFVHELWLTPPTEFGIRDEALLVGVVRDVCSDAMRGEVESYTFTYRESGSSGVADADIAFDLTTGSLVVPASRCRRIGPRSSCDADPIRFVMRGFAPRDVPL
jgi:hypothetical protein